MLIEMEFNSPEFLNIFLPLTLIFSTLFPLWTGYVLLLFSMIFYGWNSIIGLILLIFSICIVHFFRKYIKDNYKFKILASLIIITPFLFFRGSSILMGLFPSLANLQKLASEKLWSKLHVRRTYVAGEALKSQIGEASLEEYSASKTVSDPVRKALQRNY